jgi:hypothetical protein
MRKIILFSLLFTILIASVVLALLNLDFTINVEDRIYYPNESIDVNISVINRDTFTAKDTKLTLNIGKRFYNFDLGDIKSDDKFVEKIVLPQFPPGTHTLRGVINYSGLFEERFLLETYASFEVRFPEIERFPRNVNVVSFELPEKLIAGKIYNATIIIRNDGEVAGNLLIEVGSLNESVSEEVTLSPGESKTLTLNVLFYNVGITLIEARVYAIVEGEKYLLTYSGKKAFIQEEKLAKLSFDKLEFIDKKELRQNDEADIQIFLKNTGKYAASNVTATLDSDYEEIKIIDSNVNYILIGPGESFAGINDFFRIETKDAQIEDYDLKLEVSYIDSEQHTVSFSVSLSVKEDTCSSDKDCESYQICSDNKCQDLSCDYCEYPRDHKCVKYECCSDADCPPLYTCDIQLHICKPPQCLKDLECADNEICTEEGKCEAAFNLVFVPINWEVSDFNDFKAKADIAYNDFMTKSPFKDCSNRRVKVHYIDPKNCQVSECADHCTDCISEARKCVIKNGLGGIYDKFAALTKGSWAGGCADGIPGDGSSTDARYPGVIIHEIGHTVGLCHIPRCRARCGSLMPYSCSWCPNYDDILGAYNNPNDESYNKYIMDYCAPMKEFSPAGYTYLKTRYEGTSPAAGGLGRWLEGCKQ